MRLTKHRQEILNTLDNSDETMSAGDIHTALPHINLVTIYRNLEYFVKAGEIKKLHLDEQEAQYEIQHEPHHHAICNECNMVIHFTVNDKKLIKEFSLPDFDIKGIEITLRGSCHHLHQKSIPKLK
jgi:Fur family transcriptional regulator, peroxide stress response regulator